MGFGFWSLFQIFGVWILEFVPDFLGVDFGVLILDFGVWILEFLFRVSGSWILGFGFGIFLSCSSVV